jgi:DNA-directed RNA polymerase subunit omega
MSKGAQLSMEDIDLSAILRDVPNRFMLSVAVAKRARQLKEGAKPLIEVSEEFPILPVITALKEINEGKIAIGMKEGEAEEVEMLEKMELQLEKDLITEEQEEKEKATKKKTIKESKSKSKSKSLAA